MPIGRPRQSPEPKSACSSRASPIEATSSAEPLATGSRSTRRFQTLEAGKTVQRGACGSRGGGGAAAPPSSATRLAARAACSITTSWLQPLDPPAPVLRDVAEAVVQPVVAVDPELVDLRED